MSAESGGSPPKPVPQRLSAYPHSRLSAPHNLVEMAAEIERADSVMKSVVGGKLEHIARQMRALKLEADRTLQAAERDARLHRVKCAFSKRPGQVYHLYERPNGEQYFSMLAPAEWGASPPHAYRGGFRLEADMAFTNVEDVENADRERSQLRELLP